MFIFNTTKPHKTTLVAISTLDPQNINHLACGKTFNKDHTIYIVVRPGASVYKFNRRLLHFFSQQKNPINIDVDGILSFFKDHECLAILYGLFSADALVNHISSYKTIKAEPLQHNYIINKTKYQQELKQVEILVEAQLFAAELMRMPNNVLTTNKFETIIKQQFSKLKNIKVDVLNKRDLIKKHMDLILAVGQASEDDNAPRIINIAYKNKTNAKPFVLIGKGLVFDTGGLDLKPASAMRGMHMDMSGAAIVAASIYALAKLGVSANVNGLLALASNEISPRAYRTNDVIKSYGGHTIEITNTDAEGRLVLADAISYADRDLKATKIMTVATLTGGAVVSFGDVYTPV
jgi:leucyl aminopeptidase